MSETNRIEYKQELTEGLEKEVVAFLNYHGGGVIYIGIDKNENPVGVADMDGDMLKIKDRLKNNISPSCLGLFDVIHEEREGKNIIKLNLASGSEKPYYLRKNGMSAKGCFIRIGTAAEPMPVKMIEELFAKRTRNSISKIKSNKQELSFEQLKIYYEALGIKLNAQFANNLELITPDGEYNYVAYLLSDINGVSIKVAKYEGNNRVDLIESNEYGYSSLIKATKQVLDKMELENTTTTKITSKERQEKRLWNPIALREAIINAFVHNDYSKEVPPKFEIFSDRFEITSAGGLPEGLSENEFFEGFSVPRNKELMRVYKDLDLVEHLGSGVPRILESYPKECFMFSENFLRMSFPAAKTITPQVTPQVMELVKVLKDEMSRQEIQDKIGLSDRKNFMENYLNRALEFGVIEMILPDKPNSRLQKYKLTLMGENLKINAKTR
ncbi:MAG: putative DNA binding domain-containing protein [Flavobacteriaceae bacterium]|nr:putative DNA binding domain-containing protein [Flavobacteriaceae bacterium]